MDDGAAAVLRGGENGRPTSAGKTGIPGERRPVGAGWTFAGERGRPNGQARAAPFLLPDLLLVPDKSDVARHDPPLEAPLAPDVTIFVQPALVDFPPLGGVVDGSVAEDAVIVVFDLPDRPAFRRGANGGDMVRFVGAKDLDRTSDLDPIGSLRIEPKTQDSVTFDPYTGRRLSAGNERVPSSLSRRHRGGPVNLSEHIPFGDLLNGQSARTADRRFTSLCHHRIHR